MRKRPGCARVPSVHSVGRRATALTTLARGAGGERRTGAARRVCPMPEHEQRTPRLPGTHPGPSADCGHWRCAQVFECDQGLVGAPARAGRAGCSHRCGRPANVPQARAGSWRGTSRRTRPQLCAWPSTQRARGLRRRRPRARSCACLTPRPAAS